MNKIAIIGGAGYLGTRLCMSMEDVTVFDTFMFGDFLPEKTIRIKKDVMDMDVSDLAGFDSVIFLAGLSNDPMAEFMPKECFIQNAAAPVYCAYLAKRAGVAQFIYASTCSVYGFSPEKPRTPADKITCNYPYGISKYTGEAGIMALADDFFTVKAVRMGTISGYSPRMRTDLLINTMYKNLLTTKTVKISNPNIMRPILNIEDAVYMYRYLLGNMSSGVYNGVSFNISLGELGRKVYAWAERNLGFAPTMDIGFIGDLRNYKAERELPTFLLPCPEEILDSLHAHKEDIGDINNPEYNNIYLLKRLIEEKKYGV